MAAVVTVRARLQRIMPFVFIVDKKEFPMRLFQDGGRYLQLNVRKRYINPPPPFELKKEEKQCFWDSLGLGTQSANKQRKAVWINFMKIGQKCDITLQSCLYS